MNKHKKMIDNFFEINQNELIQICKKVTNNTLYSWEDLLSELYLFLVDREDIISNLQLIEGKDRPLMRYCGQWTFNQVHLYTKNVGTSNFKAKFQIKDDDNNTEYLKETLVDNEYQPTNLDITQEFVSSLSNIEYKMYQMLFIDKLSIKKVAKIINSSEYITKKIYQEFFNKYKKYMETNA